MNITQERLKELLGYDPLTGIFIWKVSGYRLKIGRIAGGFHSTGYWGIMLDGKPYQAHRLAWLYIYGMWPIGVIDHRDHDKANNRIDNLRDVTKSINSQNTIHARKNNSLGMLGASFHKENGKYKAQIQIDGKKKHLGYFNTPIEAHAAYLGAKRELHPGCTI